VESGVRAAVRELERLGAIVEPVSLPHTEYAIATYYLIATAEASSNLARYDGIRYGLRVPADSLGAMYEASRAAGFGTEVKRRIMLGTYALSAGYYDAYYLKAQQVRTLIRRDFEQVFQRCEALVTPVAPTTAFRLGEKIADPLTMYLSDIFTISVNLAGLPTRSKIFCRCSAAFGGPANTNVCPVCLGMPGVLPVLNRRVVEFAIRAGLATDCTIARSSRFARKNYFYPDLPKGYQISMYETPICTGGWLDVLVDGGTKRIGLTRIHMEEDTGKNIHDAHGDASLVDFNRSGVPLLEIVSEPDIRTVAEAGAYLRMLRSILMYLEICDGNMEEGSFRCDANISV